MTVRMRTIAKAMLSRSSTRRTIRRHIRREDLVINGQGMAQVRVTSGPEGVLFRVCAQAPS